jgi:hypothetical protein
MGVMKQQMLEAEEQELFYGGVEFGSDGYFDELDRELARLIAKDDAQEARREQRERGS